MSLNEETHKEITEKLTKPLEDKNSPEGPVGYGNLLYNKFRETDVSPTIVLDTLYKVFDENKSKFTPALNIVEFVEKYGENFVKLIQQKLKQSGENEISEKQLNGKFAETTSQALIKNYQNWKNGRQNSHQIHQGLAENSLNKEFNRNSTSDFVTENDRNSEPEADSVAFDNVRAQSVSTRNSRPVSYDSDTSSLPVSSANSTTDISGISEKIANQNSPGQNLIFAPFEKGRAAAPVLNNSIPGPVSTNISNSLPTLPILDSNPITTDLNPITPKLQAIQGEINLLPTRMPESKELETKITPHLNLPERDPNAISGVDFFVNELGANPEILKNPKAKRTNGMMGDARDRRILEEVAKGNIDPESRKFTKITLIENGVSIDCFAMNRPLAIGGMDTEDVNGKKVYGSVIVPASPQLAAEMRKHGVVMPTPEIVNKMYEQGHVIPFNSLPPDGYMAGNSQVLLSNQIIGKQIDDSRLDGLIVGDKKIKVISDGFLNQGHHEYGAWNAYTHSMIQIGAAHGDSSKKNNPGPRYADYSSAFQGVYEKVQITEGDKTFTMNYEDAVKHPQYGKILNKNRRVNEAVNTSSDLGRPLDYEKAYELIANNSNIYQKENTNS